MKQKELKNLAKQIAKLEYQLQEENITDNVERQNIEKQIASLCSRVQSFEEMELIDELVQEFLKKF